MWLVWFFYIIIFWLILIKYLLVILAEDKCLPVKDVLEFPLANYRLSSPHYVYRNLLYVYPKELNFAGRTGIT